MCALRHVKDSQAGPRALGILVPPGPKTVLIIRPRSLNWDLVLLHGQAPGDHVSPFCEFNQEDAARAAQDLFKALGDWSQGRIAGRIETVACQDSSTHQVQAEIGRFNLIVCKRQPGQPYRPMEFLSEEDARAVAEVLAAKLRPTNGIEQEVYFNTRHFST